MNPDEFEDARAKHLALSTAGNDHHFIVFLIDAIRKLREPGWHQSGGNVVITMTPEDWLRLVQAMAAGAVHAVCDGPPGSLRRHLALLNRLHAGNPNYTPYQVEPGATHG